MITGSQTQPIADRSARTSKTRSPGDWKMMVYVTIGAVLVLFISEWSGRSSSTEAILRAHFRIPEGVEFARSQHPTRGTARQIEGIIEFTPTEYAIYRASLNDPAVWKPERIAAGPNVARPPFSPRALRWEKLPRSVFAGARRVPWGNLSAEQADKVRQGYTFCFAMRFPPDKRRSDSPRPIRHKRDAHLFPLETPARLDRYNTIHCSELARGERPLGYVLGVLDDKTRTLHMIVR